MGRGSREREERGREGQRKEGEEGVVREKG